MNNQATTTTTTIATTFVAIDDILNTDIGIIEEKVNNFTPSGYVQNPTGLILHLGTLFGSTGNLKAKTKNTSSQLSKRLLGFSLDGVYCIKFCIPKTDTDTDTDTDTNEITGIIRTIIPEIFIGFSEIFIDTKNEFPDILFVKVLFPTTEINLLTVNLGTFKKSQGSIENITKNITKQFDVSMSMNPDAVNLASRDLIEFNVPIHNSNTKICIERLLVERFSDKKNKILQSINGTLIVNIFLK